MTLKFIKKEYKMQQIQMQFKIPTDHLIVMLVVSDKTNKIECIKAATKLSDEVLNEIVDDLIATGLMVSQSSRLYNRLYKLSSLSEVIVDEIVKLHSNNAINIKNPVNWCKLATYCYNH